MQLLEVLCTITLLLSLLEQSAYAKRRTCPNLSLPNGRVRMQDRDREAHFECKKNYTRLGDATAVCRGSNIWSHPTPICISRGCPPLGALPQMKVKKSYNGALFKFTCPVGTERTGPEVITCDGREWSEDPPTCNSINTMECDFEKGICGWGQDTFDNFEWTRMSGATSTRGTGPPGDHTTGSGFYLFMKSSSPRKAGDTARLISPEYPPTLRNMCFEFWYHTKGPSNDDAVGSLEIYILPYTANIEESEPKFYHHRNQGNEWHRGLVKIPDHDHKFKIVIVGTRKGAYASDIAIDDLRMFNCSEVTTTTMQTTTTTTKRATRMTVKTGGKCPKLSLPNGRVTMRKEGRLAKFKCKKRYTILGDKSSKCRRSNTWSHPTPICISRGCPPLGAFPQMEVEDRYNGALLKFTCPVGTERTGPEVITCDGREWSEDPPTCNMTTTMMKTTTTKRATSMTVKTGITDSVMTADRVRSTTSPASTREMAKNVTIEIVPPGETTLPVPSTTTAKPVTTSSVGPTTTTVVTTLQTTPTMSSISATSTTSTTTKMTTPQRQTSTVSKLTSNTKAPTVTMTSTPSTQRPTSTSTSSAVTSVYSFTSKAKANATNGTVTTYEGGTCPKLSLPNGHVEMQVRGNFAYFKCKKGYTILGDEFAACRSSNTWSHPTPICVLTTTMMKTTTTKRATSMTIKTGITDSVMTADRVRSTTSPASTREMAKNVTMEIVPSGKTTLPVPTTATAKSVKTSSVSPTTTTVFTTLQTTPTMTTKSATSTTSTTTEMTTPQRQTSTVGSSAKLSTNTKAPTVTMTSTPATSTTSAPTSPQRPTSTSTSSAVTSVYSFTSETKTNATNGNTTHEATTTTMQTTTTKRATSMTVKTGSTDSVMTADRVSSTTSPNVQNVTIEIVPSGKATLPVPTTTTAKSVTTSSVAPITTTVLTTLQTTPTTTSTSAIHTTSTTTKMTTQQRQTSTVGSSAKLSTNTKAPTATMMSTLVTSTTTAPTSTQQRKPTSTSSTVTSVFNFSSMAQPNVTNGKVTPHKGESHVTHRLHSMSPRPDGNIKSSGDDDHFTGTIENDITTPSTSGKGTTSTIPPVVPAVADVRNTYKASGERVMSLIIGISAGIIMGMIVTDILAWLWTRNQRRNKDPENAEDELNMHTASDAAIKNT
ncbi:mucin-5AC-like isoform X2 [Haliotis rufescens]|uniref:mucin-5AC-like isoform X2 n=1 Tax=Haliotis rufescens TaxID=6454 RepID=UPI00201F9B59|nr:mucin-5AC-like isoform X2 [Haliotis rufescens]